MRTLWIGFSVVCAVVSFGAPARAWDVHKTLMPYILDWKAEEFQKLIQQSYPVPCKGDDEVTLKILVQAFGLNPSTQVPPSASGPKCGPEVKVTAGEILRGSPVDDPDAGMDKDLPAEMDPKHQRKWMGGERGPSSQGFRHMFFGGWSLAHPLSTFQIPIWSVGEAPMRAEIIGNKARELHLNNPQTVVDTWSIRLVGWAMHYIQDLTQPFHVVQAVSPQIVPWFEFFTWPPSLKHFIAETTRTTSNYHWAYEGYTRMRLKETPTPFAECLQSPEKFSKLNLSAARSPGEIAELIAKASIEIAPELGAAEVAFFGTQFLESDYNISAGKGQIDYDNFIKRPDRTMERQRLNDVTCRALANASIASRRLIVWALSPEK